MKHISRRRLSEPNFKFKIKTRWSVVSTLVTLTSGQETLTKTLTSGTETLTKTLTKKVC